MVGRSGRRNCNKEFHHYKASYERIRDFREDGPPMPRRMTAAAFRRSLKDENLPDETKEYLRLITVYATCRESFEFQKLFYEENVRDPSKFVRPAAAPQPIWTNRKSLREADGAPCVNCGGVEGHLGEFASTSTPEAQYPAKTREEEQKYVTESLVEHIREGKPFEEFDFRLNPELESFVPLPVEEVADEPVTDGASAKKKRKKNKRKNSKNNDA